MTTPRPRHATSDCGFPSMPPREFIRLREQVGTQEEVATEMQTARRTLGRWERGERAVPGVAAVCIRLLAKEASKRRAKTKAAVIEMLDTPAEEPAITQGN